MIGKAIVKKGKEEASSLIYTDKILNDFERQIKFYKKEGKQIPPRLINEIAIIGDEYVKKLKEIDEAKEESKLIDDIVQKEHLENIRPRKRLIGEAYAGRAHAAYLLALKAGGDKKLLLKRLKRLANYINSFIKSTQSEKLYDEYNEILTLSEKIEK